MGGLLLVTIAKEAAISNYYYNKINEEMRNAVFSWLIFSTISAC